MRRDIRELLHARAHIHHLRWQLRFARAFNAAVREKLRSGGGSQPGPAVLEELRRSCEALPLACGSTT